MDQCVSTELVAFIDPSIVGGVVSDGQSGACLCSDGIAFIVGLLIRSSMHMSNAPTSLCLCVVILPPIIDAPTWAHSSSSGGNFTTLHCTSGVVGDGYCYIRASSKSHLAGRLAN